MATDDEPQQERVPPFPWFALRFCLTSGGDYSPNTRANPVPLHTRNLTGIRGVVEKRAAYGPVLRAVARAFNENRLRHGLTTAHWRVLMACESGLVERPDRRGMLRWVLVNQERPDAVMPYRDAAAAFGLSEDRVPRYHREAKAAVEDEWRWLHAGFEDDAEDDA